MDNECKWYDPACGLKWLADEIKAIFLWLYDAILAGVAVVIESIPVPSFLVDVPTYTLPSGLAWAADSLNIVFGVSVTVLAYTARFILRRIPLIG